jgi:hypothetical protein
MTWTIPPDFSFRSGAVRLADLAYVLAEDDEMAEAEISHTVILELHQGTWGAKPIQWTAKSACVCQFPKQQLVAIGDEGEYLVMGQGDTLEGNIYGPHERQDKVGPFRSVNDIAGKAYAVGMNRLVYRRDGRDQWTPLDSGLPSDGHFEAIDGFAEDDLYAVGWNGEIWHFDGALWSQADSPTNVILTGVCCAGNGSVYCCGQRGTVLRGVGELWEVIDHGDTEGDVWDIEWFNDQLYLSTIMFIYRLVNNQLELVNFGSEQPATTYHLSSADGVMWSIGEKDLFLFDGNSWTRIH